MNAAQPFIWGSGGRRLTPEEVLLERKNAQALGQEAMSTAPIGHQSQGWARIVQGLMAGYDDYRAGDASRQNAAESGAVIQALLAGGGGAVPAAAAPAMTPAPAGGPSSPPVAATVAGAEGGIPAGREQFVASIMPLAMEASAKTGLDPRLIVAQAALESGWGKSAPGNNLFGIKSHGLPGGNTLPTTEVVNGQPVATQDSFRAYASPAESVTGYADFMTQNRRYEPVRAAQGLEAQAAALGQSGYATDPNYGQKVLQIAQGLPAPNGVPQTAAALPPGAAAPPPSAAVPAPATGAPQINPAIVKALSSPHVSEQTRKIGGMLFQNHLEQQAKANDPLRRMQIQEMQGKLGMMPLELRGKELANTKAERELQGEGAQPLTPAERASFGIPDGQPAYKTRSGEIKFGPAGTKITNTVGDTENAFAKEAGKATATRFNDLVADGQQARQVSADVSTLRDLGKAIGTGKGAQAKAMLGPYADALGIKIEGLGNIQAYEAIVNRVAPSLRVKGAGSQSDFELKNFLKSLPSLGNTPEGNDIAAVVMEGLQQNKVLASEIASKALSGEISRGDAEKQLRNLPDPMTPYREYTAKRSKVDSLVDKYGAR